MSRARAAAPSAARTRAGWALLTLIVVNAVMLWFFLGAGASLGWHARLLDQQTLQQCAFQALSDDGSARGYREVRIAGPATVRFVTTVVSYADDSSSEVEVECRLSVAEDAELDDPLLVERAAVVTR